MIPAELLRQVRHLQLKARHLATDMMAGEYSSAFKGKGMEFDEVRGYVPGDDIRAIDWNVTARFGQPFIKVFREEREMTLMLMVDVSSSQLFGTTTRSKQETAAELAAILAMLAIANNDKIGLVLFSDHTELYIPPKKGRAHTWNIIKQVLSHEARGQKTDIASALGYLGKVAKRRLVVFLISDFIAPDFTKPMRVAAKRHDLTCVKVIDPREEELPRLGVTVFEDAESGEALAFDTTDAGLRNRYQNLRAAEEKSLTNLFRNSGAEFFNVSTAAPVVHELASYMRRRETRRRL